MNKVNRNNVNNIHKGESNAFLIFRFLCSSGEGKISEFENDLPAEIIVSYKSTMLMFFNEQQRRAGLFSWPDNGRNLMFILM